MLIELRIQNYAVIERLAVGLEPGLNVLTGETGAGKSIIVGALSLLLGERASSEVVRVGAEQAVVEGVFDIADRPGVLKVLEDQGLESEDGLLILRRRIAREGRNRVWVNGSASTATFMGELGRRLVDLHGQHEHQTLLHAEEQRAILDAYAGTEELVAEVGAAHARLRDAREELERLERRRRETEQRADFLRFQAEEIEKAGLEEGEEERVMERARRLEHSEDLARISGRLHHELYAGDASVTARVGELRDVLKELVRIDPGERDARELLDEAYYDLEELGRRMGGYSDSVEHDPGRLQELRRRQDTIFRLKKKYGDTVAEVIETGRAAREELDRLDRADVERRELEKRRDAARAALEERAAELTERRRETAGRLGTEIEEVLPALGLEGGRFAVRLQPLEDIGAHGAERVEFRVALNVGFEPRALRRVASGGELSRVMLALKTILARADRVPSLVFDEIDAGIGGSIGVRVGEKLCDVAGSHQVFVVTHLPQIAARADHHVHVEKVEREGTTLTRLTGLDGEARVGELARMLGGDPERETSRDHARDLLGAGAAGD